MRSKSTAWEESCGAHSSETVTVQFVPCASRGSGEAGGGSVRRPARGQGQILDEVDGADGGASLERAGCRC